MVTPLIRRSADWWANAWRTRWTALHARMCFTPPEENTEGQTCELMHSTRCIRESPHTTNEIQSPCCACSACMYVCVLHGEGNHMHVWMHD